MAVENLTRENFEKEALGSKVPIIIDFYADWCGPCKMLKPIFEKVSEDFKGRLLFKRLDTESEELIAMRFGIQGIPALVVMDGKKEVGRIVGYMGEEQLKSKINEILEKI